MSKRLQKSGRTAVILRDVADRADVSTATVSRVLNAPASVTEPFRGRVLAALDELGYVPNNAARALRSRKSRIVGTVIPTLSHAIYARQVDALQKRLEEDGYSLVVTTSEYDLSTEYRQARLLLGRDVEGVVLVGDLHDDSLYALLEGQGIPYINTYVYNPQSGHPCVGFDNKRAGGKLANFLADLGHRTIGMIAGVTAHNDRAAERVQGFRSALLTRGLRLPDTAVSEQKYTIEGGRVALRALLDNHSDLTAIACGSDILAFGALIEAAELGVGVPRQLSLTGFDNLEFAAHLTPPLTTIEVPTAQMGRLAAEYLIDKLAGQQPRPFTNLEARLIARNTTAPPANTNAQTARV